MILGQPVFRTLGDVPEQVGLVDVFRPPWQAPDVARQAVAAGATALCCSWAPSAGPGRGTRRCRAWMRHPLPVLEQRRVGPGCGPVVPGLDAAPAGNGPTRNVAPCNGRAPAPHHAHRAHIRLTP